MATANGDSFSVTEDRPRPTYGRGTMLLLAHTFGINHATVTTPILYQTTYMGSDLGNFNLLLLYLFTMITALFLGAMLNDMMGARLGLTASMTGYGIYAALFALGIAMPSSTSGPDGTGDFVAGPLMTLFGITGSIIGGIAAGPLWTFQGVVVGKICEEVSQQEGKELSLVSAELWSIFGLWFLGWEFVCRALISGMISQFGNVWAFGCFAVLAFASGLAFFWFTPAGVDAPPSAGKACGKAQEACKLLADPKMWLLQFTNLTFGFGAAWNASVVGPKFIGSASFLGPSFVALLAALISLIGGISSRVFGVVASKFGKMPIIAVGCGSFLGIGILSQLFSGPDQLGYGVLMFPIFMGLGRGVYESTNKGVFNDFYPLPETRAGVFANVMVFGTLSSVMVFSLNLLDQSKYVVYLLIIFGCCTIPGLMLARSVKSGQEARLAAKEGTAGQGEQMLG